MESKTAHRLIGTCVVIALVIIALPLVFNKSEETPTEETTTTPAPTPVAVAAPVVPVIPAVQTITQQPQPAPIVAKKEEPVLQHKQAWAVQMGYFKNKDNARRLTDKLRTAGFKAFTATVKNGDKERIRVIVGPEYKQTAASELSSRITKKINMQGIIVPYDPLKI